LSATTYQPLNLSNRKKISILQTIIDIDPLCCEEVFENHDRT